MEPRIVVIGAGMAGIATGVILKRKGFDRLTILEKGGEVGGVWHWNRYPGLTCDVPSNIYQYSFATEAGLVADLLLGNGDPGVPPGGRR